jgi:hypothetical protein
MRKPGIKRRIERLTLLMIHGGHAERLLEFTRALVEGQRPVKPKKATRKLAKELLPHIIQTRKALVYAEGYLLACLNKKEAGEFISSRHFSKEEEAEEGVGDVGC